jgi:hypothetical protein
MENLYVAQSTISNAGRGIFTKQKLKKGTKLGYYKGVIYHEIPDENERENDYIMEITKRPPWISKEIWNKGHPIQIDGNNILSLINGCRENKNIWNCDVLSTGMFVLNENVEKDDEIFICYGDEYWDCR